MSDVHSLSLSHFSVRPLEKIETRDAAGGFKRGDKPFGLWVSVDGEDDWLEWCRQEDYAPEALVCRHRITLQPSARICHIKTVDELLAFTKQFGRAGEPPFLSLGRSRVREIDWRTIGALFDGIIIAPYQWSLRLNDEAYWYYTWDCASGCIWNAAAIASVELIEDSRFAAAARLDESEAA